MDEKASCMYPAVYTSPLPISNATKVERPTQILSHIPQEVQAEYRHTHQKSQKCGYTSSPPQMPRSRKNVRNGDSDKLTNGAIVGSSESTIF